jgi:putative DNA primase/helicase
LRRIGAKTNKPADFVDPDPWPKPVIGDQLLVELKALIAKHAVTDDYCRFAIALWIILSYPIDQVDIMPLLGIVWPEKRCGKTRLRSLLLKLVRRPLPGAPKW